MLTNTSGASRGRRVPSLQRDDGRRELGLAPGGPAVRGDRLLVGQHRAGGAGAIDALQQSPVHYFQRPDAGYLEYDQAATSMSGHAGMVGVQKVGGQKVRFSFVGNYKTPGFDVNDVGYLRRADAIQQSSWVQFRWDTPRRSTAVSAST